MVWDARILESAPIIYSAPTAVRSLSVQKLFSFGVDGLVEVWVYFVGVNPNIWDDPPYISYFYKVFFTIPGMTCLILAVTIHSLGWSISTYVHNSLYMSHDVTESYMHSNNLTFLI